MLVVLCDLILLVVEVLRTAVRSRLGRLRRTTNLNSLKIDERIDGGGRSPVIGCVRLSSETSSM
jgi:hypothetical protein